MESLGPMGATPGARPRGGLTGGAGSAPVRHGVVMALAAGLMILFTVVHAGWSPMHLWNRAFGDASLVLVAAALAMGPLARLWRPASRALAYRREVGVYATLLAIVHGAIVLAGWVQWDLWRLFGFELHPQLGAYVMVQPGFALANAIGVVALAVAILLALTSNDLSMRALGSSAWKFLQMGTLPLWWLTVAHVGYFLFAHFLSFHRPTPAPSPLQWPFVALVLGVLALRGLAFLATLRRRSPPARGALPAEAGA